MESSQDIQSKQKSEKKWQYVIFLDHDGPVNAPMKRIKENVDMTTYLNIVNLPYLKLTLEFLNHHGVLVVPGSQRLTYDDRYYKRFLEVRNKIQELFEANKIITKDILQEMKKIYQDMDDDYYEQINASVDLDPSNDKDKNKITELLETLSYQLEGEKKSIALKEPIVQGYNDETFGFGRERNYLNPEHMVTIGNQVKTSKGSKLSLLENIKKIPGAENISPDHIYHVDDDYSYYQTTKGAGYQFIWVKRAEELISYFSMGDNAYLANMLNIIIAADLKSLRRDFPKASEDELWQEAMKRIKAANFDPYIGSLKSLHQSPAEIAKDLKDLLKTNLAMQLIYEKQQQYLQEFQKKDPSNFKIPLPVSEYREKCKIELMLSFENIYQALKKELIEKTGPSSYSLENNPGLLLDFADFAMNPVHAYISDYISDLHPPKREKTSDEIMLHNAIANKAKDYIVYALKQLQDQSKISVQEVIKISYHHDILPQFIAENIFRIIHQEEIKQSEEQKITQIKNFFTMVNAVFDTQNVNPPWVEIYGTLLADDRIAKNKIAIVGFLKAIPSQETLINIYFKLLIDVLRGQLKSTFINTDFIFKTATEQNMAARLILKNIENIVNDKSKTTEIKQKEVQVWINNLPTLPADVIAEVGLALLKGQDTQYKTLFAKEGIKQKLNVFATLPEEGWKIIHECKDRICTLAENMTQSELQDLMSSSSPSLKLLHSKKHTAIISSDTDVTEHEKQIIRLMVKKEVPLLENSPRYLKNAYQAEYLVQKLTTKPGE